MRIEDRLRIYWLVEALWVVAVILIFKYVEERRSAAMVASSGFVLIPLGVLIIEILRGEKLRLLIWAGHLQFLILFALPIVVLNFFPYLTAGVKLPLTAQDLHRFSNLSYFLMIFLTLIEQRRSRSESDR